MHDPVTKLAFPGNVVPKSYLTSAQSQVGQNIIALFANSGLKPNIAGTTTANNYLYNPQRIDNGNAFDVKVDHQFTDNDSAFLRYSHSYDDILQPGLLPTPLVGAPVSGPARAACASSRVERDSRFLSDSPEYGPCSAGRASSSPRRTSIAD